MVSQLNNTITDELLSDRSEIEFYFVAVSRLSPVYILSRMSMRKMKIWTWKKLEFFIFIDNTLKCNYADICGCKIHKVMDNCLTRVRLKLSVFS